MLNTMIRIVFLSISIVLSLILVIIIKNWWITIKLVARDFVSVYAAAGYTFLLIFPIYWDIQPAAEWDLVDFMLLTIHYISTSMLIYPIINRLQREAEDLGMIAVKLRGMKTALRRLDSLQRSNQCNRWLKKEEDLQREIELAYNQLGYFKGLFSLISSQRLRRANELLVQGDNLVFPKDQLWRGMNYYKKVVIDFIENPKSGLLGIWGMGGVGKTSLLKLLVGDSRSEYADDSFQVLLVRAGIGCTSVGQVQQAIATSLGLCRDRNEASQAKIIHDHLQDKSFLLLIDDLWEYLDLKAVGIPWPLGTVQFSPEEGLEWQTRHKVVFTSRYMGLCHAMGCSRSNTIRMKCFDEDDAWELLGRGWSVFRTAGAVNPEQNFVRMRRLRLSRPKPDTVSDVQPHQPQHPRDDGLSGGMTDNYEKVCSFIESRSEVLMGIWGMQGVGKTTLLRFVHDSYSAIGCFDHIMFVGAGTGHMVSNVQHAIAINLGLDWGMMSSLDELSRGQHIFDHLQDKSFLLLLDDIREPLNWWVIGLPLLLHKQQKIILATRSEAACALMGCADVNTIEMRCLEEYDACKLFDDKVELDDRPQIRHLREQMVSRCGGLPLAICSLGRAMSNKRDPSEWRCAYNQLRDMSLEPCEIDDKVGALILNPPLWEKASETEDTSLPLRPHVTNRNISTPSRNPGWTPSGLSSGHRLAIRQAVRRAGQLRL